MACSCGKAKCKCGSEFCAPIMALAEIENGLGAKNDVVAVAWEREDGKVYRYDLEIPKRLSPEATKFVSHVVDRIAKFIVWAAGGWKLYLAGPRRHIRRRAPGSSTTSSSPTSTGVPSRRWSFPSRRCPCRRRRSRR